MSILGPIAWQFARPKGDIYDDAKNKCLCFLPAGYSQTTFVADVKGNCAYELNRQELYATLCSIEILPEDLVLSLSPEPDNIYDKNAIQILMTCPSLFPRYSASRMLSLGYVPKRLCPHILPNLWRVQEIFIESLTSGYKDKFFIARIGVRYS